MIIVAIPVGGGKITKQPSLSVAMSEQVYEKVIKCALNKLQCM